MYTREEQSIRRVLMAQPVLSDRRVAKFLGYSPAAVASVRRDMLAREELPRAPMPEKMSEW